ncbi:putative helicase mov-10-B.1 [Nelusetta ayraudi]|uniref:putative helicase mov-10-B.1 n=1 Tax=Nelusetta ayraudi TaxID=303726 RepID=UPI003F7097B4
MKPVNWETYHGHQFQLLKWEAEILVKKVHMTRYENEYMIQFPDWCNKYLLWRPRNTMLVCPEGHRKVKYKGWVTYVEGNNVTLHFNHFNERHFQHQTLIDVVLTDNTWNMNNQRKAVENAGGLRDVLFPQLPTNPPLEIPDPDDLRLFNEQLRNDPEQYQAVKHIVAGTSKPAAYVLFGPPGTGKTVTLVEAIMQIEQKDTDNHILACASHNKDADLICQELVKKVDKSKVLRMYAKSRDSNNVPSDLHDCCNLNGKKFFAPPEAKLMKYKIIVTTLFNAVRLNNMPKKHFTHIFLDNAERAPETECLIPIAGLHDTDSGQLVVAGDPKQFGPIVKSRLASQHGRGVSLLERWLTNSPPYQRTRGVFNKRYVTKLQHNYRSHPDILKVPGDLFSDGELIACPDTSLPSTQLRNSCANWEHLPSLGFPVIFHSVYGVARRDRNNSFYNTEEVDKLMYYVKELLQTKVIKPSDIGIMARYKKQVQEISKALQTVGKNLQNKLKVGTVERFQGQERTVILLSTICSSGNPGSLMGNPENFVKDEKAFYVAVTRAKALLIVVGDPTVWRQGDTWHHFINYCREKKGYRDDQKPNDKK